MFVSMLPRSFITSTAHAARVPLLSSKRGLASGLLSKTQKDWLALSASQLRKEAKGRGLAQNGSKSDLASRLVLAEQRTLQSTSLAAPSEVREISSSARYNREVNAETSKFTPRRPYLLDVKIPESSEDVAETTSIPYLPDYYESHHTQSASPVQETPADLPRVLTVASAATHEGGGPLHGVHGTSVDAHSVEVQEYHDQVGTEIEGKKKNGIVASLLEDAGFSFTLLPSGASKAASNVRAAVSSLVSTTEVKEDAKNEAPVGELDADQKRGLYVLGGIVGGGWILGKLFS